MVWEKIFEGVPIESLWDVMLPCQPEFQFNQPKNLLQPFSYLIMIYMKVDFIQPIHIKHIFHWNCEQTTTMDGRRTIHYS